MPLWQRLYIEALALNRSQKYNGTVFCLVFTNNAPKQIGGEKFDEYAYEFHKRGENKNCAEAMMLAGVISDNHLMSRPSGSSP